MNIWQRFKTWLYRRKYFDAEKQVWNSPQSEFAQWDAPGVTVSFDPKTEEVIFFDGKIEKRMPMWGRPEVIDE